MPDLSAKVSPWFPLIAASFTLLATVLGFGSSQLLEWFKDRRAYEREKEARDVQRRDAWTQRRNAFQTQTLIELQDVAAKWIQAVREVHFLQKHRYEATGTWPDIAFPSELSERIEQGTIQVDKLSSRVRDEQVRIMANRLKGELGKVLAAEGAPSSERAIIQAGKVFYDLNDRIGVLLRDLDSFEP